MTSSLFRSPSAEADIPAACILSDSAGGDRKYQEQPSYGKHRAALSALSDTPRPVVDRVAALGPATVSNKAGGIPHESLPDVMKVPLGNSDGQFALIDAEDYPLIKRYKWTLNRGGYAQTGGRGEDGAAKKTLLMHRLILMTGPSRLTDHKNRDRLDNRKANLRHATNSQNGQNATISVLNTTGIKGVTELGDGWRATVICNRIPYKRFFRELADAKLWVESVRAALHGEFACNGADVSAAAAEELEGGVPFFASDEEVTAKRKALNQKRALDKGADYFQAQGRLMRERVEGGRA